MAVRKLRVLTLVDKPTVTGGAERLAAVVAMKLDPARFESVLCASRQTDEPLLDRELEEAGIGVLALGRRSKLDLLAWRPLVSLLRDGVDVVHTHMFGSNVWGTVLGRLSGVPVVVAHEHAWSFQGRPLRRFLDRELVARLADVFVAVSGEDRRKMIEVEGVDPAKTSDSDVIPLQEQASTLSCPKVCFHRRKSFPWVSAVGDLTRANLLRRILPLNVPVDGFFHVAL